MSILKTFSAITAGTLLFSVTANASLFCDPLANKVDTLIQNQAPTMNVGIAIMDAKTGNILYQHNGYQAFSPASNTKIFTAAAALYELGSHYHYETKLSVYKSQDSGGTLNGNVYLTMSGDPTLTIDKFQKMIETLKAKGVDTINGNFIIDHSRFQEPNYAPGSSYDDSVWYYSPPISAMMFNENALYFQINPSDKLGGRAKVYNSKNGRLYASMSPSNVKTTTWQKAMSSCSLVINVDDTNNYTFKGCWPITGRPKGMKLAIRNPFLFADSIIRHALKKYHITLKGSIESGSAPNGLTTVATYKSPSLKHMVRTMMKNSNNVYAESLTKTLGYKLFKQGSFQQGVNAIEAILHEKTDIDMAQLNLADGAGASAYDLITPLQFTRLLYVVNQAAIADDFLKSLPDSGSNGTLRERMTSDDMKNAVMAKTGTIGMAGVSTLSGYITSMNGQQYIFSILVNHNVNGLNRAHELQDDVLSILRRG